MAKASAMCGCLNILIIGLANYYIVLSATISFPTPCVHVCVCLGYWRMVKQVTKSNEVHNETPIKGEHNSLSQPIGGGDDKT